VRAPVILAAVLSFFVGSAVVGIAPASWRLAPWQGLLFGTALYMGVLHRWIARPEWDSRMAAGLVWRAALFIAFVAGHAYTYFEWIPAADVRAPFVMLSGWVVAETLLSPRAPRGTAAPATGSWPRA
jgi:hypothetical protein